MSIGLTGDQRNLIASTTVLGVFLIGATLLLRSCVFPTAEEAQLARIQKTADRQFLPYVAVIDTFALQNPALAVEINKAEDCARAYLKSLLSPAHPVIMAGKAAEATRVCARYTTEGTAG